MQARKQEIKRLPQRPAVAGKIAAILVIVLSVVIVALALALPARADHNELYVVCPSPITEGETDHMEVTYPGYRGIGVTVFTYEGSYTASGGSDFVAYDRVKMKGDSDSSTLYIPARTIADTVAEHDETFALGFWVSGMWHGCVITIVDDDTPKITDVAITSTPANSDTYRVGELIDVTVTLDKAAQVVEIPLLTLLMGNGDGATWRGAAYYSGSGTETLVFRYQAHTTDFDTDGVSVSAAEVDEDGIPTSGFSGRIYAKGTDVPIDYTHSGIEHASGHKVDGRPYVQSARITSAHPAAWEAYRANQIVELTMTFNSAVVVEGNVHAELYVGYENNNASAASRPADYRSGSGSDTLVFAYTVRPGDMDARGIRIAAGSADTGFGGSGTIKAKGTDVERNPHYDGSGHLADHRVDTAAPTIASIDFASQPSNGTAYATGETVSVAVVFNEDVTTTGDLQLELDIGGESRLATLSANAARTESPPGRRYSDSLVFQYTVQAGDTDSDGIGISPNSLKLNGGRIYDSAGNGAGLSHTALAADSGQKVDTSASD